MLSQLANTFGIEKLSLKPGTSIESCLDYEILTLNIIAAAFYSTDLLTNLKQSLDELSNVERSAPHYNDKSQLVLNVLDISSVVFLHSIFTEEERKTQWNSLLSLLCSFTDLSFIHYILQKVNFHCFGWSTSVKQLFQRAIAEILLLRFANTARSSTGARLL